jgi:hypothetical protein
MKLQFYILNELRNDLDKLLQRKVSKLKETPHLLLGE